MNTKFIVGVVCVSAIFIAVGLIPGTTITYSAPIPATTISAPTSEVLTSLSETIEEIDTEEKVVAEEQSREEILPEPNPTPEVAIEVKEKVQQPKSEVAQKADVFSVPFYSQLTDISAPAWKKIGCGIASLAMLIKYYNPDSFTSVDTILNEGIAIDAYSSAGWTYAGLIKVSHKYGLDGTTHDFGDSSMDVAFAALEKALALGPVMASVHYTFTPTNPIPHLVIVNGIKGDTLFYNDPAEPSGNGSIPVAQFKSSWKKRYIEFFVS